MLSVTGGLDLEGLGSRPSQVDRSESTPSKGWIQIVFRRFTKYEQILLAAIFIGCIVCVVGIACPYWGIINAKKYGVDSYIFQAHVGIWIYCVQLLGISECKDIDVEYLYGIFFAIRSCAIACVSLGFSVLLFICCCQGIGFVFIGIICLIAGIFGITAVGIFIRADYGIETPGILRYLGVSVLDIVSIGWTLIIFSIGVLILIITSLVTLTIYYVSSKNDRKLHSENLQPAVGSIDSQQPTLYLSVNHPSGKYSSHST